MSAIGIVVISVVMFCAVGGREAQGPPSIAAIS